MRYITVEQFREQPEGVQQVLLDWWRPKVGDLVRSEKYEMAMITENMMMKLLDPSVMEVLFTRNAPLFTLQQLWEFIEDKYGSISISKDRYRDEYHIYTLGWCNNEVGIIKDKDKLQAFWKCSCEVARVVK